MQEPARVRGLWCASLTPLAADGGIDTTRLVAHIRSLFARGVDGAAPFGTTGEGPSFSVAERRAALEALLEGGVPVERVLDGTGTAAFPDAVDLTRHALGCGVARCLVVPPFFYKNVADEAVFTYYAKLIDAVADDRLRLYLYHIPQFSGVSVTPATVRRLAADFPGVIGGVKDSGGDWRNTERLLEEVPDLDILVGHEPHLPRLMGSGGAGTICGVANVYPEIVAALLAPAVTAEDEARIEAVLAVLAGVPFVPAFKTIRAAQTGDPGWAGVRPPWIELDTNARQALFAAIAAKGLPLAPALAP
ncbi:MAG: dihydrodipicolinate synthase family protein [Casimicrobiaceae bacterium]